MLEFIKDHFDFFLIFVLHLVDSHCIAIFLLALKSFTIHELFLYSNFMNKKLAQSFKGIFEFEFFVDYQKKNVKAHGMFFIS